MSPLSWWPLNDAGTTLTNIGSSATNGSYTGTYYHGQPSIFNGIGWSTTAFDGTSGQATTAFVNTNQFNGLHPFTVVSIASPSINRSGASGTYELFGNVSGTGAQGFYMRFNWDSTTVVPTNVDRVSMGMQGAAANTMIWSTDVQSGMPAMLATTYSGGQRSVAFNAFYNGHTEPVTVTSDLFTAPSYSQTAWNIASRNNASLFYPGTNGDQIIFPYQLTPNQIKNLYLSALGASPSWHDVQ